VAGRPQVEPSTRASCALLIEKFILPALGGQTLPALAKLGPRPSSGSTPSCALAGGDVPVGRSSSTGPRASTSATAGVRRTCAVLWLPHRSASVMPCSPVPFLRRGGGAGSRSTRFLDLVGRPRALGCGGLGVGLIRRYGAKEPTVIQALLRLLTTVRNASADAERWSAIETQANLLVTAAEREVAEPADLALVYTEADNLRQDLARRRTGTPCDLATDATQYPATPPPT
jgi:hypothetical protein